MELLKYFQQNKYKDITKKITKNKTYSYIFLISIIIIIIILFNVLYLLYQYYIVKHYDYHSYIELDKLKYIQYNNNLKIAVLLTGNVQHISTLISQKFFIYDILKPDIYAVIDCNELLYQEINDLLKPKYINFNYKTKENFENNTMVDFHKIILANQQKKNYEVNERKNYDIVIRIRADLFVKNYIPSNIINNIEENTIYVPLSKNNYFSLKIGINDYFALSNSNVMDKYVNYFNYLKDIYNKKNIVQCSINEYLLKKYIENNGIKIVAFPYVLVIDKLKSNQIFYFYVMIKQYFKNLNDKFHCVLDDVDFS